jgi:uncharacterized protein (UPF0332 family)
MNLGEISLAFKGCNGESSSSFKDYLIGLNLLTQELNDGITITDSNNYILRDIEILLDKAIINLGAADLLLKKGYFHWGFVTSYYSNFFSVQALNRLQINFNTWTEKGIECKVTSYLKKEIEVKTANSSKGSHNSQFHKFYENYLIFRNTRSIDRYWTLAIREFRLRAEALLRDEINYSIENYHYYELELDLDVYNKIINDNKKNPSAHRPTIDNPKNYSLPNLELALSRIRVTIYILNYLANANLEYKSYFERRCKRRINNIKSKYPNLSSWLLSNLEEWLQFVEVETDDELTV